jgi:hypothetical protein
MIVRRGARADALAVAEIWAAAPDRNDGVIRPEFVAEIQLTSEFEDNLPSIGFRLNHVHDFGHVMVERSSSAFSCRMRLTNVGFAHNPV